MQVYFCGIGFFACFFILQIEAVYTFHNSIDFAGKRVFNIQCGEGTVKDCIFFNAIGNTVNSDFCVVQYDLGAICCILCDPIKSVINDLLCLRNGDFPGNTIAGDRWQRNTDEEGKDKNSDQYTENQFFVLKSTLFQ